MTARPSRHLAAEAPPAGTAALWDPLPGYTPRGALCGRRALVVGGLAGGGPGRAVAAVLAKEGAAVALADTAEPAGRVAGARPVARQRLGDDPVLLAAGLVSALGAWSLPIHCDPASESGVRAATAHSALEFGAVDLMVVYGPAARADAAPEGSLRPAGAPGGVGGTGVAGATGGGPSGGDRLGAAFAAPGTHPGPVLRERGLSGALRAVREARPFLSEGAAAVLLGGRSAPGGAGLGTRAQARSVLRALAGSLRGRQVRLNCLLPLPADTDAAVAAAVADLAAGSGRAGDAVGVSQVPKPPP
ncbi:hypothetical protein GCM10027570_02140 [Streptomonospora sediminis]